MVILTHTHTLAHTHMHANTPRMCVCKLSASLKSLVFARGLAAAPHSSTLRKSSQAVTDVTHETRGSYIVVSSHSNSTSPEKKTLLLKICEKLSFLLLKQDGTETMFYLPSHPESPFSPAPSS